MIPTLLIVEDDRNDALFLQMALKNAGVTNPVQVVVDGGEDLAYLSAANGLPIASDFLFLT